MTMVLYISLVFLVLAFLVAGFSRALFPRVCFGGFILVWVGYLLYFQFEGIARITALQPPEHPLSSDPYVIGVIAFKDALVDFRLSVFIIVIALIILMFGIRRRS
jgi:hypothetical protein